MIRHIKNIICTALLLASACLNAALETSTTRVNNPAVLSNNSLLVTDSKYGITPVTWTNKLFTSSIEFGLDEQAKLFPTVAKIRYEITFDVTAFDVAGGTYVNYTNQKLVIIYDRTANQTYLDKAYWTKSGFLSLQVSVTNIQAFDLITSGSPALSSVPFGTYLEGKIETTRFYDFNSLLVPPTSTGDFNINYIPAENAVDVSWPFYSGAEEYELEWTWVNDYTSPVLFSFKNNATRIVTTFNHYKIPLTYESGYLLFRYRAAGYAGAGFTDRVTGMWTTADPSVPEMGLVSVFPADFKYQCSPLASDNINWSATATFDENGKHGNGVAYADGLLKGRQSNAVLNTEAKIITQSSLYDFNGRPVINFLPVPLPQQSLNYVVNNYITAPSVPFDKETYDGDNTSGACNNVPNAGIYANNSLGSGAENYYSSYNTNQEGAQAMLPDAEAFPFVQVEYTPDMTGRIRSTTQPGATHKTGSGKETTYFYANPGNQELDRLFGSEVGNVSHYEKNAVVDANGQTNVSYIDMTGRVIATALTGNAPLRVDQLESYSSSAINLEDNLLEANKPVGYALESSKTIFVASPSDVQTFEYEFTPGNYGDECSDLCYDCIYELELSIKDECRNEYLDLDAAHAGIQNKTIIVGNIDNLDGFCTSPASSLKFTLPGSPLSLTFLKAGTYTITKKLKVSEIPISKYSELFVNAYGCGTGYESFLQTELSQLDFTACGFTCIECSTSVNQYAIANSLSTAVKNEMLAKCQALCEADNDQCAVARDAMIHDLIPGGQYATYNSSTFAGGDQFSIFYGSAWRTMALASSLINTHQFYDSNQNPVSLSSVTAKDFINQFQDAWAEAFLPFHPEFSYLEFCDLTQKSLAYDELMRTTESYDEACTKGLLNPLNIPSTTTPPINYRPLTTGCGNTPDPFFASSVSPTTSQAIANSFARTSFTIEFVQFNSQPDLQTSFNTGQVSNAIGSSVSPLGTSTLPAMSFYEFVCFLARDQVSLTPGMVMGSNSCTKDAEWEFFKNLYLSKKQILYERTRAAYTALRVTTGSGSSQRSYNGALANPPASISTEEAYLSYYANSTTAFPNYANMYAPDLVSGYPLTSLPLMGCCYYYSLADPQMIFSAIKTYNSTASTKKSRRFIDVTLFAANSTGSFGSGATGSSSGSGSNQTSGILANGISSCTGNANNWMVNLSGCMVGSSPLVAGSTTYNNIRNALINVCSSGVDPNNPWGASSGVSAQPSTSIPSVPFLGYTSFQGVLNAYLGANGNVVTCNANLISFPNAKDHSLNPSGSNINNLNDCGCEKISKNELKFAAGNLPTGVTTSVGLFNYDYNASVSLAQYNKLKCKCKSIAGLADSSPFPANPEINWSSSSYASAFSSLGTNYQVPAEFGCSRCVDCEQMGTAKTDLTTSGHSGYVQGLMFNSPEFWPIFTNYFNNKYNFNFTTSEYSNYFMAHCMSNKLAGPGSRNWIDSTTNMVPAGELGQEAEDLLKLFQRVVTTEDKFIKEDTMTLAEGIGYYGTSLYPQRTVFDDHKVKYKGRVVGSDLMELSYYKNDTLNILGDTIFIKKPSAAPSFTNIIEILEIFGNPDSSYYGDMRGFYLSAIFRDGDSQDTLLLSGFTNRISFAQRSVFSAEAAEELCTGKIVKHETEPSACFSSMTQQAEINAHTLAEQEAKAELDAFIARYKANCLANITAEKFKRSYALREHHYTLYYYDQAGNLVKTVPPKGVVLLTSPADLTTAAASHNNAAATRIYPKHEYLTNYTYQSFDGAAKSENPDELYATNYFYDFLGRIVASQNSKQSITGAGSYSYSLYDELGRIKEVGTFELSGTPGDNLAYNIARDPALFTAYLATHTKKEVTKTYYDQRLAPYVSLQFTGAIQDNLRNRVASVTYEDLDDGNNLTYNYATHYSYDQHGNVKEMIQDNSSFNSKRYSKFYYEYDLVSGNVKKVYYQRNNTDQFIHRYEYDADNRLHEVYTSTDNVHWEKDAKYFYYEHGPLARTETGDKQVQGTDYAYTLQGWIKGVNSEILNTENDMGRDGQDGFNTKNEYMTAAPNVHSDFASDAAAYTLNYFDDGTNKDYRSIKAFSSGLSFSADKSNLQTSSIAFNLDALGGHGPSLYNGNISSMVTTIVDLDPSSSTYNKPLPQLSAFRYDQLNRLKQMTNYKDIVVASGVMQNQWATIGGTHYNVNKMNLDYDANGNISTLVRRDGSGVIIDNLDYKYYEINGTTPAASARSNKLIGAFDNAGTTAYTGDIEPQAAIADPTDVTHASWNYDYDAVGSLIADKQEHIQEIQWTVDKKVRRIIRDGTPDGLGNYAPDVEYQYNAQRQRVLKIARPRDAGGIKSQLYWTYTYYNHDAQGNTMAVYEKNYTHSTGDNYTEHLALKEQYIYGSARIGTYDSPFKNQSNFVATIDNETKEFIICTTCEAEPGESIDIPDPDAPAITQHTVGLKLYELTNHLGNVLSVITDRKLPQSATTSAAKNDYEEAGPSRSALPVPLSGSTQCIKLNYGFGPSLSAEVHVGDVITAQMQSYYTSSIPSGLMALAITDANGNFLYDMYTTGVTWYKDVVSTSGSWQPLILSKPITPLYIDAAKTIPYTGKIYYSSFAWSPVMADCWFDEHTVDITYANPIVASYRPEIISGTDYYAFGQSMPGRSFNSGDYRYGMNGQEKDDEVASGIYTAEYWEYDSRTGRRWNIDPVVKSWESPYTCFRDNPIYWADPSGLDGEGPNGECPGDGVGHQTRNNTPSGPPTRGAFDSAPSSGGVSGSSGAIAPKWSLSIGNTTRPSGFHTGGGSGPTSLWTSGTTAYNTAVNYNSNEKKFLDFDETNFSLNFSRRISGRYSYNVFTFKEKLDFDKNHYNNEAPQHFNLGGSASSDDWIDFNQFKMWGAFTVGGGIIIGAPRFDDDQNSPDPNNPGKFLKYGEVYHHGGYVNIPPGQNNPKYWITGGTATALARVNASYIRFGVYIAARATMSMFSQQATSIGTIPRTNIGSVGLEGGIFIRAK